ncbi:MAG TPA: hypothetical protein VEY92_07360 [Pseudoxanthomonas sp.]|nr:hypothetical protein [Pseudoxanthomonas sp.]
MNGRPVIGKESPFHRFDLAWSSRRWRRLRVYPVLALWLSVCGVAACRSPASAGPPQASGPAEVAPAAQTAERAPAGRSSNPPLRYEGPTLSEAQWEEKAYAVIDNIRQRTDLTPAHVERVIGMKLVPDPGTPSISDAGGATTIGGGYSFMLNVPYPIHANLRMALRRADTPENGYSPTCTFEFARVKRRLEGMGFEGWKSITGVPYRVNWRFANGDRVISAQFHMVKRPGEGEDKQPRLCLESLTLLLTYPKETR